MTIYAVFQKMADERGTSHASDARHKLYSPSVPSENF